MGKKLKRLTSLLMAFVVVIISFPDKAYAYYDGEFKEWLFDVALTNTLPAVGNYAMEQVGVTADLLTSTNPADGVRAMSQGFDNTKDMLGTVYFDTVKGAEAVWNTFENLMSPKAQDALYNIYDQHKHNDIVLSPELQFQLNNDYGIDFNLFVDSLLNVDTVNFGGNPYYNPVSASDSVLPDNYISYSNFLKLVESGTFFPFSYTPSTLQYDYMKNYSESTAKSLKGLNHTSGYNNYWSNKKYFYAVQGSSSSPYGVSYFVDGSYYMVTLATDYELTFFNREWYVDVPEYHKYILSAKIVNPPSSDYAPPLPYNLLTQSGSLLSGNNMPGPKYYHYPLSVLSSSMQSGNSRVPFTDIRAVKYVIDYSGEYAVEIEVQNTFNNIYSNTENFYDNSFALNYTPTEIYLPAQKDSGSYDYNADLDFSRTINNYIENKTYEGDTNITYITNLGDIINNYEPDPTEPTDPTDPTEPTEPTEPTDPTEPTEPTDPDNGDDKSLWDKIKDFFGVFKDVYEFVDWLLDKIGDFLKWLFVPEEGFMDDEINNLYESFLDKLPVEGQLNMIMSLTGSGAGTVSLDDYKLFSSEERSTFIHTSRAIARASPVFEDITIIIMGVESVIVSGDSINLYLPQLRVWIDGILSLVIIAFNLNGIYFMVKGVSIFNPNSGVKSVTYNNYYK